VAETDPDAVWHRLVTLVMDNQGGWRRRVSEATGLPFTRVRALRRLAAGPLAMSDLARALTADAPATTLAVNDLAERGLVLREAHPTNGRVKVATLTDAGREMLARVDAVEEPAPEGIRALAARDLGELERILALTVGA
jgi:DNA-binding MarR family transcriptional regulator